MWEDVESWLAEQGRWSDWDPGTALVAVLAVLVNDLDRIRVLLESEESP